MKGVYVTSLVLIVLACVLFAGTILLSHPSHADDELEKLPVRIGIFDSRAVAIAYARSAPFGERIAEMQAELKKAKEAGDTQRVEELETTGPNLQELLHKQGFGTWPVDDILETIEADIPKIAGEAGVDLIVSKWDVVYQEADLELINITDFMVKPFHPDKDTWQAIEEIQKIEPLPLDE